MNLGGLGAVYPGFVDTRKQDALADWEAERARAAAIENQFRPEDLRTQIEARKQRMGQAGMGPAADAATWAALSLLHGGAPPMPGQGSTPMGPPASAGPPGGSMTGGLPGWAPGERIMGPAPAEEPPMSPFGQRFGNWAPAGTMMGQPAMGPAAGPPPASFDERFGQFATGPVPGGTFKGETASYPAELDQEPAPAVAPAARTALTPMGAPPMPGRPSQGAGGPATSQGGGMDLPSIIQAVKQAAPPGTPPAALAKAVDNMLGFMDQHAKIQWQQARTQLMQPGTGTPEGQALPAGEEARARAIADGRAPVPSREAQRAPEIRRIINRAYEINPDLDAAVYHGNVAAERSRASAEPRALSYTLNRLTAQDSAVTAFENTALKNGQILLTLAEKVDKTGVPVIERWIRAGRASIAGDPDVTNFNAQIQLFGNEVAKILTNPNLTGVLTDTARKEVENFLPAGASLKQIKAIVPLLARDFKNRSGAIRDEIKDVQSRLKGGKSRHDVEEPAAGATGVGGDDEDFRTRAKANGYSDEQIDAFLKKRKK